MSDDDAEPTQYALPAATDVVAGYILRVLSAKTRG
jgi:hypothetical protein